MVELFAGFNGFLSLLYSLIDKIETEKKNNDYDDDISPTDKAVEFF
jgi:hypothetical protein